MNTSLINGIIYTLRFVGVQRREKSLWSGMSSKGGAECNLLGSWRGTGRVLWAEDPSFDQCVFINHPGGRKSSDRHLYRYWEGGNDQSRATRAATSRLKGLMWRDAFPSCFHLLWQPRTVHEGASLLSSGRGGLPPLLE